MEKTWRLLHRIILILIQADFDSLTSKCFVESHGFNTESHINETVRKFQHKNLNVAGIVNDVESSIANVTNDLAVNELHTTYLYIILILLNSECDHDIRSFFDLEHLSFSLLTEFLLQY